MTEVAHASPPPQEDRHRSLLSRIATRYHVDPAKMLDTLKQTAFKQKEAAVSNEQMMALLIVADQYGLNPFTREIYAFPDKNGIVPVVGVDGWARIINEHPQFDGMSFTATTESCTCTMYRKDRTHPIEVTEFFVECKRDTQPWKSHPRRMLRHKAMIQCARLAFGFAGIYDPDEAERIGEAEQPSQSAQSSISKVRSHIKTTTIDNETGEILDSKEPAKSDHAEPSETPPTPPTPPRVRPFNLDNAIARLRSAKDTQTLDVMADELRGAAPDEASGHVIDTVYEECFKQLKGAMT